MSQFTPAEIPDGKHLINGKVHMRSATGGYEPIEGIKAQDILQDELVRKMLGHTIAASDQLSRLKEHCFEDIAAFDELLAQNYGTKVGGKKGNKSYMTVDGLYMVKVAVQDRIDFGPELAAAKSLIDECLNDWTADAVAPLRAIVTDAFKTDKVGQINRSQIFILLRREVDDPRWQRGMDAIRDAMRVVGSKTYIRFYRRDSHDSEWQTVTLDLAKA